MRFPLQCLLLNIAVVALVILVIRPDLFRSWIGHTTSEVAPADSSAALPPHKPAQIHGATIVQTIHIGYGDRWHAIDGDTALVKFGTGQKMKIRLFGIDAPEIDQQCKDAEGKEYSCGQTAQLFASMLFDPILLCDITNQDFYDRQVAICYYPSDDNKTWIDLGDLLVRSGVAIADRRYSDRYVAAEEEAKAARRNLWSGEFMMPEEWRAQHKSETQDDGG